MSCEEIKLLLDEYLTDELDKETRERVEAHLHSCDECRNELEELKKLKAELKELNEPLPQAYNSVLMYKIKKERKNNLLNLNRYIGVAVAGVALVCALGIGYGVSKSGLEDRYKKMTDSSDVEHAPKPANEAAGEENGVAVASDTPEGAAIEVETFVPAIEVDTEAETEAVTEAATVDTNEIITEAAIEEKQEVDTATPEEEERKNSSLSRGDLQAADELNSAATEATDDGSDIDGGETESIPMVAPRDYKLTGGDYNAALTYSIFFDKTEELINLLEANSMDYEEAYEGVYIFVKDMAVGDLENLLKPLNMSCEASNPAENQREYTVLIKVL